MARALLASRGRLGAIAAHKRHGPILGKALLLTPQRKGGLRMATMGILSLRDHGFGGRFETDLQRAWRTRNKAEIEFYAATRRPAHRRCVVDPCRRCRRILKMTLQRRLDTVDLAAETREARELKDRRRQYKPHRQYGGLR